MLWNVHVPFPPKKQREKQKSVTRLQGPWWRSCKVSKFLFSSLCTALPALRSCFPCNTDLFFVAWPPLFLCFCKNCSFFKSPSAQKTVEPCGFYFQLAVKCSLLFSQSCLLFYKTRRLSDSYCTNPGKNTHQIRPIEHRNKSYHVLDCV